MLLSVLTWFLMLLFIKQTESKNSRPSAGDIIIDCNTYYRYTPHGGATLFIGSRVWAFTNILMHDVLNVIDPKFETFFNISEEYEPLTNHNTKNNYDPAAIVLGICHEMQLWYINNSYDAKAFNRSLSYSSQVQQQMIVGANEFFGDLYDSLLYPGNNPKNTKVSNGYNYGMDLADYLLSLYNDDGWNANVEKIVGTYPYQPGTWYSAAMLNTSFDDRVGMVYPQFAAITPLGIGSASTIQLPPRPDLDTPTFYSNYQMVLNIANLTNPYSTRTPLETLEAITIGSYTPTEWNNLILHKIIDKNKDEIYKDRDIAYLFAQQSLSSYDTVVWVYYWKKYYNKDRPIQLIRNGGGSSYPQYPAYGNSWTPLLLNPPHPEYPGGHTSESSTGLEAIRQALYKIGVLTNATDDVIPGGPYNICYGPFASYSLQPNPALFTSCSSDITFNLFSTFKDKVARARNVGGMHYLQSNLIGRQYSSQIASYNIENHMLPL